MHVDPHKPATQYGADESHWAADVQLSAMHWLPRQTRPSWQVEPTGMLLAWQSASSTQQRFGLGFVQAPTALRMKMIATVLMLPRIGPAPSGLRTSLSPPTSSITEKEKGRTARPFSHNLEPADD